jgi:glycosyltransferase involved in cell wall biosynthesis
MNKTIENKRIKVVWLCHFANQEMKEIFNTPDLNEFAPWITQSIELLKRRSDIDLHIVAPNICVNKDYFYQKDGISYHFFKYVPIPFYNKYFRKIYNILRISQRTNFSWIKKQVSKIVYQIQPEIIHLHGAENAFFYSSGILPLLDKYHVLTTIQGFVSQSTLKDNQTKNRILIEKEIITKVHHFGIRRTIEMKNLVLKCNSNADFHYHNYPIEVPSEIKDNIGKNESIDCLFFASVCKDKGIEDLLHALSIVKKERENISLSVVGGVDFIYLNHLRDLCKKWEIEDNVKFLGFLPTQKDIFKLALKAKLCILPTYHDILPGTIIESMYLKLPVIAYAVGGIPELNNHTECIKLVTPLDVEELADSIECMLDNSAYRNKLAENAYKVAKKSFNNNSTVEDIIKAYKEILNI